MQFLDKIKKFIKDNSLMSPVEVSLGNHCSSGSLPTGEGGGSLRWRRFRMPSSCDEASGISC